MKNENRNHQGATHVDQAAFHAVAKQYDLMNDLMSGGLHRLWKDAAIRMLSIHKGQTVLDLAGGTGDLTLRILKRLGDTGNMILADLNDSMMKVGRDRLIDRGHCNVNYLQVNAETLPFENAAFDRMIIGFGLRNVLDKPKALRSMARCLKPGGKALVLEFSKPTTDVLNKLYDVYSFGILPKLGNLIAKSSNSYQAMAESIRAHPSQEKLKTMMQDAGFEDCEYTNLCGGIVTIHTGYVY